MTKRSLDNELVTVVMSAYNHEKYVKEAIVSVLEQSHQNIEFLITDDGSSDGTADIIREIRDQRIVFTPSETNRGACEAINSLIKKASGKFVCMMNSDDLWIDQEKIKKQLNVLKDHPDAGACSGMADYIDESGRFINEKGDQFPYENNSRLGWIRRFFLDGNILCHPSMMIRRECYETVGYYKNIYRQLPDYDLWVRLVKKYNIIVIDEKIIAFRIIPGRNASTPSVINMIRDQSEHYLIRSRFLEDISMSDFVEAFRYEVSRRDIISDEIFEIEKALLYFTHASSYWHINIAIGLQKMALLMEDSSTRKILIKEYGIDDHWIHKKTSELDCFYKSTAKISDNSKKTELNLYTIQKYLFKQLFGIFKNIKPKNFFKTAVEIKKQFIIFRSNYINYNFLKNRVISFLKIAQRIKNSIIIHQSNIFIKEHGAYKRGNTLKTILHYLKNWERKQNLRKPMPGFHPGVYASECGIHDKDPFVEYIVKGKPQGAWNYNILSDEYGYDENLKALSLKTALQIHAYYPEMIDEIISRINQSKIKPDLLVSVRSDDHLKKVSGILESKYNGEHLIRVTPNRGRDLGPLLTGFRDKTNDYDLIGHFHTKASPHLSNRTHAAAWYHFLLENVIGGKKTMLDIIIKNFVDIPQLGLVFPDDPHVFGWGSNYKHAQILAKRMGVSTDLKHNLVFPAGSMFWARTEALTPLYDLCLEWTDYPAEPIDTDGTMLHAIERLIPHIVTSRGFQIAATYVPGITY